MTNKIVSSEAAIFNAFNSGMKPLEGTFDHVTIFTEASKRAEQFVKNDAPFKTSVFRKVDTDQGSVYLVEDSVNNIALVCLQSKTGSHNVFQYKKEKGQVAPRPSHETIEGDETSLTLSKVEMGKKEAVTTTTTYKKERNEVVRSVTKEVDKNPCGSALAEDDDKIPQLHLNREKEQEPSAWTRFLKNIL